MIVDEVWRGYGIRILLDARWVQKGVGNRVVGKRGFFA
jgi:hypothetical protein